MKKLIALLSLVVFTAPAFALNGMSVSEAVGNLKNMASISRPNELWNIEPAIATLIDAYHAEKPFASLLAETELEFVSGEKITLGEYLDGYVRNNLYEFRSFNQEIKKFEGDSNLIGQFILYQMADPMTDMSDEEAKPLAERYINYTVNGEPLVQFTMKPDVMWHRSALDELRDFGKRVKRLAE